MFPDERRQKCDRLCGSAQLITQSENHGVASSVLHLWSKAQPLNETLQPLALDNPSIRFTMEISGKLLLNEVLSVS